MIQKKRAIRRKGKNHDFYNHREHPRETDGGPGHGKGKHHSLSELEKLDARIAAMQLDEILTQFLPN